MSHLILFMLLSPLVACVGIVCGLPEKRTAMASVLANLVAVLILAFGFQTGAGGYQFVSSFPAIQLPGFFNITFKVGVDGLALPMVLLTSLVSTAAVALAPENIRRRREFYICILLVVFGALGAFFSIDLFFLYVFHEVALIPTFLLIGIWGGVDRKFAATQLTLYLAAGSLVLLAGLLAFYFALPADARSFDLEAIRQTLAARPFSNSAQSVIYPLLLAGFGILVSLFPFHTWAPAGYAAAPTPAAMLHAGVLKKFGLYGLLRLAVPFLPFGMQQYMNVLLLLLLANVIYVGLVTINQKELNYMLGYSSVMHMGFLFLGLAALNEIGLTGLVLLMVAHGLSVALLFGLSGEIRARTGSTRFSELGGLAQKTPILAFLFIFAGLASLGMPGLGNFSGEILIFFGAWAKYPYVAILAVWGVVISAVYVLRAVGSIFFGDLLPSLHEAGDVLKWAQRWPFVLLSVSLLVVGVYPKSLMVFIKPAVQALLGL
ncbi:MAG: NADH-quinone oxidoreductase subunit M [Methylacidiphilales bacterium]|nr:NADH-quinone oxidoreductase subunit M [Candidatus Methylacidiphilales bacterium]